VGTKWEGKSLVGGKLGQFDVKEEIARGGMGVVYKGYQPSLDRWVAIKTLPIDLAGDRDLVARFQREAEAMVRLNHANIVQIIDRGEDSGQYYFAMEFVEGPSVKDLLKKDTIDTDKLFDMLTQTCDGLEYAHKKGLVHRDIKPANLLFEEKTGTVKIADFGIAHFSKKDEDMLTLTADNVGMGTMNYMSPEQKVNAKTVDHRSDIYALGVIIYEGFTGKLPLGKFKLPSEVNPKLPRQLDVIVQKCLEAEPDERFESCAVLKAALLGAKAATNDKTLKRSMRDALDRTLTAVSPKGNKTVGCFILLFVLLVVFGAVGVVGFLFWKSSAAKQRLTRASKAELAALERAKNLGADHGAGKSSFEDGEQIVRTSESLPADAKAAQLEAAAGKFNAASLSAIDAKKSDVKALLDRIEKARARATPLSDGIAKAARTKLDGGETGARTARDALARAEQPEGTLQGFDLGPATASISDGESLVDKSEKLAAREKEISDQLAQAKPDSPERKAGEEKLAALKSARESGDASAAFAALNEAAAAASAATNTPKVDTTTPTPQPTQTPTPPSDPSADGAAIAAQAAAASDAEGARRDAERVLESAKAVEVTDGGPDFDAGLAAQREAADLKPRDAAARLKAASASFKKACDAALGALDARRKKARDDASGAKDQPEYAEAESRDGELQTETDPAARARLMVRQITKWKEAAQKALGAGRAVAQDRQHDAERTRDNALARLGPGGDALLKNGDAALERGKKALGESQVETAKTEFASAATAYAQAAWPTPKTIAFPDVVRGMRVASNLKGLDSYGDDAAVEQIAGCPKGFVVSHKDKLFCYDLKFNEATQSATAPGIVSALCAGEGDDIFVATFNQGQIVRYSIAKATIKQEKTLPGDLGQPHDDPALALAYDPRTRSLYTATKNAVVFVYSVATGEIQGSPIDLKDSNIATPYSIAVLSDGSFVVSGEVDKAQPGAESALRFGVARYKPSGEIAETNRDASAVAVAAAGDGIVAVDHAEAGRLWIWPKIGSIPSGPDPALSLQDNRDVVPPKYATKLALFGRLAFVLDRPLPKFDPKTTFNPKRSRVKIFELKD
jgi:predicted Ser/Thr protein kinase